MPPPDEDLREFLAERRYATLATSDPEGGIHLTPVWFLFEDDRFLFASLGEVDAQEFGGILGETPERWFLPLAR